MTEYDNLKPREIEILRLMSEGLTNREIGERLYIGVETVRWYAKQIYSKLHVSGRGEAAEKATKLGLLEEKESSDNKPKTEPKHNLPTQLTSFIGREKQIAEITKLLNETRLLTLTGPGGTGKTRLSLKVAENRVDNFADGVYFVDLASITEPERIPKAIAAVLGVIENAEEAVIKTLKRSIGDRKLLLVIDNFEHVITGASFVSNLLTTSKNLKILATSREALRLSGEQEFPVPPLSVNQPNDETQSEAISLFMQRAQRVRPSFRLDESNMGDIINICRRVDGLPLAIELAAARCKLLTPQALLKRLESRLASLTGGSRDVPQRQQTLQATIDWSYNLLDDDEKRLFERLAVFRGGRSLEAIETVCTDGLPIDVLDGLASLVDKSMIRQIEDDFGEPRFMMLETLQEYAWQQLNKNGEVAEMQRRHVQYFMELTERAAPELRLAHQEWWFTKLDIEQDNIRAAMTWALSIKDAESGARIIAALRDYWWYQGSLVEGYRWTQRAMAFLEDIPLLLYAGILSTAAGLAVFLDTYDARYTFAEEALKIYRELNHEHGEARMLIMLGTGLDMDKRIPMLEDALVRFRSLDDKPGIALALNAFGYELRFVGQFERAKASLEECLNVCSITGEVRRKVLVLHNLGEIALSQGQIAQAALTMRQSLELAWQLDFPNGLLNTLWGSFRILVEMGHLKQATQLYGAIITYETLTGQRVFAKTQLMNEQGIEKVRAQLDETTFNAAWVVGKKVSLEEAVEFALQELSDND